MNVDEVIGFLKQKAEPAYLAGMKRFGIDTTHAIGVRLPELRKLARIIKKDHLLAIELWDTGLHEARMLASMIDDPACVTKDQIDNWTKDFNSWDLCDQVCGNLFDQTPFAIDKAIEFSATRRIC